MKNLINQERIYDSQKQYILYYQQKRITNVAEQKGPLLTGAVHVKQQTKGTGCSFNLFFHTSTA